MSKLHAAAGTAGGLPRSICGMLAVTCTDIRDAVTCKLCVRKLAELDPPPLPDPWRYEGERLKEVRAALEQMVGQITGEYIGPQRSPQLSTRWASVSHAIAEMAMVDQDGHTSVSLSDPDRMDRLSGRAGGRSSGEAPPHPSDDLHAVRAAWRRAFVNLDVTPLSPGEARAAVLLRHVGGADIEGRRRTWSPTEIAAWLADNRGYEVSPKRIGKITRRVTDAVYEYLRVRELVPKRKERPGMGYVEEEGLLRGWKEIAEWMGCHIDTARGWARIDPDPMPVRNFLGRVEARKAELKAWRDRRAEQVGAV